MAFLLFSVIGLIITIFDVHVRQINSWPKRVTSFIMNTLYPNLLSLVYMRFIFQKNNLFVLKQHSINTITIYVITTILIGLLFVYLKRYFQKNPQLFNQEPTKTSKKVLLSVATLFFILGAFLFIGSVWFIAFFGKLTPEQFIFNFNSPVTGTADSMTNEIYDTPVLILAAVTALFLPLVFNKFKFLSKITVPLIMIISFATFALGCIYSYKELQLGKVYQAYFDDSPYVQDNYVAPKDVNIQFPEKKRNLVHIYLESYENSYFDKKRGGYMTQNLMPDLQELMAEGIHFSNNESFGGPYQTYGSSWSVASMINMSAGLPLKIPIGKNSYGKSGYFLPGAETIGDILAKEGYEQTIMFGANADFGGLTSFFSTHGDFNIFDLKHARKAGLIPQDYKVWWGYEDAKLYQYAKDELTRLAATGKPFNLTMENADTHFPNGYLEPGAAKPFRQQYANVIFHSQKEVVNFVRWIQEQPFYDNTTIVLTGDHLSMDKKFFKNFDSNYHRTTTNLILNADFPHDKEKIRTQNRDFGPFDMYPTILSSLDVKIEGDKLGLGTDLASNKETLLERDGVKHFDDQLARNSKFYNNQFVSERNVKK